MRIGQLLGISHTKKCKKSYSIFRKTKNEINFSELTRARSDCDYCAVKRQFSGHVGEVEGA